MSIEIKKTFFLFILQSLLLSNTRQTRTIAADVCPVIQIRMHGSGDNHQFFIVSFEFLESILTEITRMCLWL